jgi:hypothetical protein
LMEQETMEAWEFEAIMKGEELKAPETAEVPESETAPEAGEENPEA